MCMFRHLAMISLLCSPHFAFAIQPPSFAWARVSGTVNSDSGRGFAVDTNGNSYVTGSFDGTATFGNTNITSSGGANRPDIYVAKYDSSGRVVWVRRAGGTGTDKA